ncbi:hypothetical protein [Photobacterium phosphoreum]|uniref:hypothetical protein n=1 Tax=Photobacterium phosphoreum TaxID=659 RepID=UPI000D15ADD6|nr:hypothetical protein [Photobacterium phosphoreum]PTB31799.1 hypothetical protein DAT36_15005 [Photobacterium phosphoreum]
MKKLLSILVLSSVSLFANAATVAVTQPVLAQINSISVYSGDNVDNQKIALKTIDKASVPDFAHCAVYLPKNQKSATTTIKLARNDDGKLSISCGG